MVNKGDTLFGIAKSFGTTVDDLKRINNLSGNNLIIGQEILIPNDNSIKYTVKSGDTLYKIANMYETTVDIIKENNNLNSNILNIGQVLDIPSKDNKSYTTYVVKSGDTLYKIANVFDITVDQIKEFNNLTNNNLSIGEILNIPLEKKKEFLSNDITYQNYIVKKGDSLYKIADMFNMSVDEIILINNLKSDILTIGQVLRVKKQIGNIDTQNGEILECFGTEFVEPNYQTYTVKKGDSLYVIANKFNTTVNNLINLNNLKTNNLSIGQILKIKEIK